MIRDNYLVHSFRIAHSELWRLNPLPAITLIAGITSTGRVAYLYFHAKKVVKAADVLITVTCWIGHDSVKERVVIRALEEERRGIEGLLRESREQLGEQRRRIEELERAGGQVGEVVDRIERVVQQEEEHMAGDEKVLVGQGKNIEELEGQIARLKGLLMAYREEEEELREEITQSEERKRQLQADIEGLLGRFQQVSRDLGEKVKELGRVNQELAQRGR